VSSILLTQSRFVRQIYLSCKLFWNFNYYDAFHIFTHKKKYFFKTAQTKNVIFRFLRCVTTHDFFHNKIYDTINFFKFHVVLKITGISQGSFRTSWRIHHLLSLKLKTNFLNYIRAKSTRRSFNFCISRDYTDFHYFSFKSFQAL
jgi:hypothetical protein